ncbi:hypothetical protein G9A89_013426 [Geosiphon pyriformis]|nr:hypothetical protein G9A89_013426 [Geosiphon pyriformis]
MAEHFLSDEESDLTDLNNQSWSDEESDFYIERDQRSEKETKKGGNLSTKKNNLIRKDSNGVKVSYIQKSELKRKHIEEYNDYETDSSNAYYEEMDLDAVQKMKAKLEKREPPLKQRPRWRPKNDFFNKGRRVCPSLPIPKRPCQVCNALSPIRLLLTCRDCHQCMHADCYGLVGYKEAPLVWHCDPCKNESIWRADPWYNEKTKRVSRKHKCSLCHQTASGNSSMKRTANYNWGHIICVAYFPEVSFRDAETMTMIEDVIDIRNGTALQQECSHCNIKRGATMKCADLECKQAFHLPCAQKSSSIVGFEITPMKKSKIKRESVNFGDGLEGDMTPRIWCGDHSPSVPHVRLGTRGMDGYSAIYTYIRDYKQFSWGDVDRRRRYRYRDAILPTLHKHYKPYEPERFTFNFPILKEFEATENLPDKTVKDQPDYNLPIPPTFLSPEMPYYTVRQRCKRCGINVSPFWWPENGIIQDFAAPLVQEIRNNTTNFPQYFRRYRPGRYDVDASICHGCYWEEKEKVADGYEESLNNFGFSSGDAELNGNYRENIISHQDDVADRIDISNLCYQFAERMPPGLQKPNSS